MSSDTYPEAHHDDHDDHDMLKQSPLLDRS